ncbi:hypothetical protein LTR62_005514 [Meristemomyces frigidus]|uniref:Uncharacterized protein n=1 Tax=Meristemomyces frigidus TaxID=1508187 RepID=A0AAN7TPH3_9PEZI|nr:hypothetical protein LTR62_005514 [Meristemomyces frigidus]
MVSSKSTFFLAFSCVLSGTRAQSTNTTATVGVGDVIASVIGASPANDLSATQAATNATASGIGGISTLPITSFPYGNPTPTWTVAASGTGSAYAVQCNAENVLYSYLTDSASRYGGQSLITSYTTFTSYSASTTTLCDGVDRVVGTLTPLGAVTNSTVQSIPVSTSIPSPTCVVSPSDYTAYVENPWQNAYRNGSQSTFVVSLDASLTAVTINGSSSPLPSATTAPKLTIDGTTFAANAGSTYFIQLDPFSVEPFGARDSFTVTRFEPEVYNMPQLITASISASASLSSVTESVSGAAVANMTETCPCTIAGQNVRLLYFPVTTSASRNMCQTGLAQGTLCPYAGATVINAQNSISISIEEGVDNGSVCPYVPLNYTSTKNSGPYIVSSGTTFYENRAYLAFDVMSATRACGYEGGIAGQVGTTDTLVTTAYVGSTYTNGVIELPSTDLYSGCGYSLFYDPVAYSFNFADLNQPIPASAFLCQPACFEDVAYPESILQWGDYINGRAAQPGFCSVILEDQYRPNLLVPPQARTLDPEWSSCVLKLEGLFDPPVALQQQVSAAAPTVPAGPTTTSASPASAPTTKDAPRTSAAADSVPTSPWGAQVKGNSSDAGQPVTGSSTLPATQSTVSSPNQASTVSTDDADPILVHTSDNTDALTFTFAGSVYIASSAGGPPIAIDPSTSTANASPTLLSSQTTVLTKVAGGQTVVSIDGTTLPISGSTLPASGTTMSPPSRIIAGHTLPLTTLPNGVTAAVVASSTLTTGGPPVTINGTVLSLASDALVVDGTSQAFPTAEPGWTGSVASSAIGSPSSSSSQMAYSTTAGGSASNSGGSGVDPTRASNSGANGRGALSVLLVGMTVGVALFV